MRLDAPQEATAHNTPDSQLGPLLIALTGPVPKLSTKVT